MKEIDRREISPCKRKLNCLRYLSLIYSEKPRESDLLKICDLYNGKNCELKTQVEEESAQ